MPTPRAIKPLTAKQRASLKWHQTHRAEINKRQNEKRRLRLETEAGREAEARKRRESRARNIEVVRTRDKLYSERPDVKIKRRPGNRKAVKKYRDKHREDLRLKCADYRQRNLESENARSRAARSKERAADPAASNARIYAFLKKNPEKAAAYSSAARAKRKNSEGSHTAADIKRTWNQQGHKCNVPGCTNPIAAIGKHKYHVDHIKALTNGGTNYPENIQCLCGRCNVRKHAQDEYAWAQREIGTLFVL